MEAIVAGDYKFEPEEYWANVSQTARDFVTACLTIDPASRPTAEEALKHPWLASATPHYVPDPESPSGGPKDLLPQVKKAFDARKTCKCTRCVRVRGSAYVYHAQSGKRYSPWSRCAACPRSRTTTPPSPRSEARVCGSSSRSPRRSVVFLPRHSIERVQ